VCIYIYLHLYICVYIYTYIHTYIYISIHHVCIYICVRIYICVHIYIHIFIHIGMVVFVYVQVCLCVTGTYNRRKDNWITVYDVSATIAVIAMSARARTHNHFVIPYIFTHFLSLPPSLSPSIPPACARVISLPPLTGWGLLCKKWSLVLEFHKALYAPK